MSDYVLQFKFKNGPMLKAMRANGIENAAELSRASGVTQSVVGKYLNLKRGAYNRAGNYYSSVMRISEALHVLPEMLFPEQHLHLPLEKNSGETEISLDEIKQLTGMSNYISPEATLIAQENDQLFLNLLDELAPRERKIIEKHYGLNGREPLSMREVAADFAISPARAHQIEQRAFKKLRKPWRGGKYLEEITG